MHFLKRYLILLTLTATITGLIASCSETKISQCQKIIQVTNQTIHQGKSVIKGANSNDTKVMVQAANLMETAAKNMAGIKVQDKKLRDYQSGFIKVYQDNSQAMQDYAIAFEKKDLQAAQVAQTNIQQANVQDQALVQALNQYCLPQ